LIAAESGGVKFTEDGLSGICIFNLSRQIKLSAGVDVSCAMGAYEISIDFVPELFEHGLAKELTRRTKKNEINEQRKMGDIKIEKIDFVCDGYDAGIDYSTNCRYGARCALF